MFTGGLKFLVCELVPVLLSFVTLGFFTCETKFITTVHEMKLNEIDRDEN